MGNVCFTPLEGGKILVVNVPNPAGAADWFYTVPPGYEMSLLAVTWQVSTSALVGDRYLGFFTYGPVADPVLNRVFIVFTSTVIANQARTVVLALDSSRTNQAIVDHYHDALPNLRCPAGFRWGGTWNTSALVGDQFFNIRQTIIRWRV